MRITNYDMEIAIKKGLSLSQKIFHRSIFIYSLILIFFFYFFMQIFLS